MDWLIGISALLGIPTFFLVVWDRYEKIVGNEMPLLMLKYSYEKEGKMLSLNRDDSITDETYRHIVSSVWNASNTPAVDVKFYPITCRKYYNAEIPKLAGEDAYRLDTFPIREPHFTFVTYLHPFNKGKMILTWIPLDEDSDVGRQWLRESSRRWYQSLWIWLRYRRQVSPGKRLSRSLRNSPLQRKLLQQQLKDLNEELVKQG